jgi:hypothetical protein
MRFFATLRSAEAVHFLDGIARLVVLNRFLGNAAQVRAKRSSTDLLSSRLALSNGPAGY